MSDDVHSIATEMIMLFSSKSFGLLSSKSFFQPHYCYLLYYIYFIDCGHLDCSSEINLLWGGNISWMVAKIFGESVPS